MDFTRARQMMIDTQIRPNGVTDRDIVAAFSRLPRESFVPKAKASLAYAECEIETSPGRALWTPRDFALLVAAADPKPSDIALVIGAGAGYETALLAQLVETAIGLEETPELVSSATDRLGEVGVDRGVIVEGKLADGLAGQGPYDLILVNGMVENVPTSWTDQLSEGGRLAIVVRESEQVGHGGVFCRAGDSVAFRQIFDACPPKFTEFNRVESFTF